MSDCTIENVTFIGAGTMGCANALNAALAGFNVTLFDISSDALAASAKKQREYGGLLIAAGLCSPADIEAAIVRIDLNSDMAEACRNADLISESVVEQLPIKRKVHHQLDALCPPKTIVSTNSSGLVVSEIEDVVKRGDKFAALHTHLGSPLVDIVGGPRTSRSTIAALRAYTERCGGVALISKEYPSYLLNGMIGSLVNTAIHLAANEMGSFAEIDQAWINETDAAAGPFGMMDFFGLDVVRDSWLKTLADDVEPMRDTVVPFLDNFVSRGNLGVKTGEGFYQYPTGMSAYENPSSALADILITAVTQKALIILSDDVASADDIDLAWTVGMMLHEGPLARLKRLGADAFISQLNTFFAQGIIHCPDQQLINKTAMGV